MKPLLVVDAGEEVPQRVEGPHGEEAIFDHAIENADVERRCERIVENCFHDAVGEGETRRGGGWQICPPITGVPSPFQPLFAPIPSPLVPVSPPYLTLIFALSFP